MPIYEYQCGWCGQVIEHYMSINENGIESMPCKNCGRSAHRIFSTCRQRVFNAQFVEDIQDKPVFVRNRDELRSEINRFNDSELASKQGKVRIHE